MGQNRYDAIVVGARCAGSPTAMLLARRGYKVLVVDRAKFPSDTFSTHILHPPAVAAMQRWGLLDRLVATGCPPIHTYSFDFGPFTLSGAPGTADAPVAYCPRRTVLDKLLVDAASEAGAEVREEFTVKEIVVEDDRVVGIRGHGKDGATVTEHADVVVGADGRNSFVAKAVRPEQYNEKPPLLSGYYSYWSGLPMDGRFEVYIRPGRGFAAAPTHDDLTLVIAGWPYAEYEANKHDVEGNYLRGVRPRTRVRRADARRQAGGALRRVRPCRTSSAGPSAQAGPSSATPGTTRTSSRRRGSWTRSETPSSVRPRCDESFSGSASLRRGDGRYQTTRDEHVLPMFEFTCQLATLEPPPPDLQQLFGRGARQPGGYGRIRTCERRRDITDQVLRRGERRLDVRPRSRKVTSRI